MSLLQSIAAMSAGGLMLAETGRRLALRFLNWATANPASLMACVQACRSFLTLHGGSNAKPVP